jgi:hypothetical protein
VVKVGTSNHDRTISLKAAVRGCINNKLEITGCGIKYSTVLWLLELQIRRGRRVQTQVHAANSKSRRYML